MTRFSPGQRRKRRVRKPHDWQPINPKPLFKDGGYYTVYRCRFCKLRLTLWDEETVSLLPSESCKKAPLEDRLSL